MPSAPNSNLNNLGDQMKKDAFRQAFVDDSDTAMENAVPKVIKAAIPPKILDALKACNKDQLDHLASVGQAYLDVNHSTTAADGNADPPSGIRMV